jgi:hypothetical protein
MHPAVLVATMIGLRKVNAKAQIMPDNHPQRVSTPAAPGELLKRAFDTTRRIKLKETVATDPAYLAMVRCMPCVRCGDEPCREAAHVRMQSAAHDKRGGIGKKPADKWAVPLCSWCHTRDRDSQHQLGERAFWGRLGINPLLVCERLFAARGNLVKMRVVIISAISERRSCV